MICPIADSSTAGIDASCRLRCSTCRDEGIAVEQLRRISFFEDEVNLETNDRQGGTEGFTWPIVPRSLDS